MHSAYIGLGSNLGDRLEFLRKGVAGLQAVAQGPVAVSSVYETDPVDYTDQPRFLNLVACLKTDQSPRDLLSGLHEVERLSGRQRDIRYGPRTLDLDILLYDDDYVCFADLQIPHPRLWQRAFVLVPLAELLPNRRGLGGIPLVRMAESVRMKEGVRYVGSLWAPAQGLS